MRLRAQAALAAIAAVTPLAAIALATGFTTVEAWLAVAAGVAGAGVVAALWSADMRRLDSGESVLPAHKALGRRLARAEGETTSLAARLAAREGVPAQLLEALPDPVLGLDAARQVALANAAANAQLGGADLPALLRHPALVDALRRAEADQAVQSATVALSVPLNRSFEVQVVPIALADSAIRTLVVARDRTRESRLDAMRADFVANASHELRTPLASLIGFIETLRGPAEGDQAAQRRFLAIMHDQAARMRRLIDDLLSLSRIELVEHAPPTERLAPAPLLARIADGFEPRILPRNITLDLTIEPDLPEIPGDADQLAQVLVNLLDNAVKYGREGGTISLSARRVAPASGTAKGARRPGIAITVQDDGPGIPPEHLPRLTERFYRVDAGRSRAVGGTGLGLAIVKHIVNRHRGRLEITSSPGQGSRFEVWLPAGPVVGGE